MFSNPNSYLSGGNSSRPGQPGYGQPQFSNAQSQQPPNGFAAQHTGFNNASLQQPDTGYPSRPQHANFQPPPQQPQHTGYPPQTQQAPQMHSFQTGQAARPQVPEKTGQTSSQIAQSFSSAATSPPPAAQAAVKGAKIPKIRLSFLTAQDQAKFEQLFKSAVGDAQALDGEKVKDLLIRSKLPGSDLMQIWVLSDTTKSGQLLFPEFALAMYLCNLKLTGKQLPPALPEKIANEVSSMVDIISFGVPDDRPPAPTQTNAPNFDQLSAGPTLQQPQPQASNSQLLSQLTSQPTGFASQYIPPQPTGFATYQTGFGQQQQNQQNPQPTGYQDPRAPMPPMPTGYGPSLSPAQTSSAMPLNAQPTGRPGQWGLVNAPASGLPNIDLLQQRMMPQPGREGGFTTQGLSGTAIVPWAVTKDEKKIYDQLFKAWDGFKKGFIGGDVAIEVMGQSGLPKTDLEKIWTLADPSNRGRLDMDEFAVAMHLIYRKLNGYSVPNQLPPELVPPSTRNFADSIGTVKSLLSQDAETRKNTSSITHSQKKGVSYLKSHSFRGDSNGTALQRKDATIFRNNDDDVGYKSSARRRIGAGGRTPSPLPSASPSSETSNDELSVEQLHKKIREKQVLLDAIDFKGETDAEEDDVLDRRDRRDAEDLYRRIRRLQEDIDRHPGASLGSAGSDAERRNLKRHLKRLTDRLPELASQVRRTERNIADTQLELFRIKDSKANPRSASVSIGTGPGGAVTESDRLKARAKAMMQQRSAALTGKTSVAGSDDSGAASRRLEEERSKISNEKDNNERMIRDVEDSVREFSRGLEDTLAQGNEDSTREHERRRWEDGLGVEDEVRDFIFDLQRSSRSAKVRRDGQGHDTRDMSLQDRSRDVTPTRPERTSTPTETLRSATSQPASSYSSYKTAEDRAAFIKQQAEQRMAERLAALGLKLPNKTAESAQQKQEREARERENRIRQAEAEDAKRDQERRRRLADELPSPPSAKTSAKKPPPPPSRKSRADSGSQRADFQRKAGEGALKARAEHEGKEQAIRDQQQVQEVKTKEMEDATHKQEDDLAQEREAAQERLRALEEQVKQGKVKKQEEKRRKLAAEKEAKEKEAKLAAQRAELEAAREKERLLQLQLESLEDESSSDEEGPQDATPQETTPTNSQILSRDTSSHRSEPSVSSPQATPAPTSQISAPAVPSIPVASSTDSGSKNPFFKQMQQASEATTPATSSSATSPPQQASSITSPPSSDVSTNPFHRLTQQGRVAASASKPQPFSPPLTSPPAGIRNRMRQEEDEWSVVDSSDNSDGEGEEEDRPDRGSAKHLASILFGTMGPPRPLSAMDDKPGSPIPESSFMPAAQSSGSPVTATPASPLPVASAMTAPPPPPPMPGVGPSNAPPPPPPMPGGFPGDGGPPGVPPPPPLPGMPSGPPAGLPDRSGLLGDIQKGKGLRKVETKDRSQSSVAGRVL